MSYNLSPKCRADWFCLLQQHYFYHVQNWDILFKLHFFSYIDIFQILNVQLNLFALIERGISLLLLTWDQSKSHMAHNVQ